MLKVHLEEECTVPYSLFFFITKPSGMTDKEKDSESKLCDYSNNYLVVTPFSHKRLGDKWW